MILKIGENGQSGSANPFRNGATMNKQQILQLAKQDPRFSKAVLIAEQRTQNLPIAPESLDELVKMLEFVLNNPKQYPQIRQAVIKDRYVKEEDMPPQFNAVMLISMLILLYGMQEHKAHKLARGGLATAARQLQAHGRNGDTMLAHINPQEAEMLRQAGGSGSINPATGLPEFFDFGDVFKIVLPIALDFIAPGLGEAIGGAMGLTGTAATMAGSALIGGASSALTGGNFLQGAVMGGLGGGLGNYVGGAADSMLGTGLGEAGKSVLGSGLIGGAMGAATGNGFLNGAIQGAGGAYLGQQLGGVGEAGGSFNRGATAGGAAFGNALTAGYDPKTALMAGSLSGLAAGMSKPIGSRPGQEARLRPSDSVIEGLKAPTSNVYDPTNFSLTGQPAQESPFASTGDSGSGLTGLKMAATNPATAGSGSWLNPKNALMAATVLGALTDAPPQVKQAVSSMSPEQKAYFNRPNVSWDWNKLQRDASASGMSLSQFMAQNWNNISGYQQGGAGSSSYNLPTTPRPMAQGGMLSPLANMARGSGSGRDDTIDAKLSDGEYVMDAETVALLGDGSTKEGANRLDQMRNQIRMHKGQALAKGKFSPNARSPLSYLKGVA